MKLAVIFDFDGTLADSFSTVMAVAYRLTGREELADINKLEVLKDQGVSLNDAIKRLDIPKWQWPYLLKKGRRLIAKEIGKIEPFDGIKEMLAELKQKNFNLLIISSNSRKNIEVFLKENELNPYFDAVYGGAAFFGKLKLIQRALKSSGLDSDRALYVGDEVRDVLAADEANMECIAVNWGYNSDKLLRKAKPLAVVGSPVELLERIEEWSRHPTN